MKIFDYEDIQLIPNKCIVESRSECDTTVQFGPKHLNYLLFQRICKLL